MADLGNLADFFEETEGPVDLGWLSVDPEEYRATDTLPRQNLDMVPDLKALWGHEGREPSVYAVPNRGMLENFADHGLRHMEPPASLIGAEEIKLASRQLWLQTQDTASFLTSLAQRYDKTTLANHRGVLASVLQEKGLLGPYYLDSLDFPSCQNRETKLAQRYASTPYVLAKPDCSNCQYASQQLGSDHCSVFGKTLVAKLDYTEEEASKVEAQQRSRGFYVAASKAAPKERIRLALLAPVSSDNGLDVTKPRENKARSLEPVKPVAPIKVADDLSLPKAAARVLLQSKAKEGVSVPILQEMGRKMASATTQGELSSLVQAVTALTPEASRVYVADAKPAQAPLPSKEEAGQALIAASRLTQKKNADFQKKVAAEKARPIIALLRKEMLRGSKPWELESTLRASFDIRDLKASAPYWTPVAKEAGLYGEVYITQDSFSDCKRGAAVVEKYQPQAKVVIAGAKCQGCIYNKLGGCEVYRRPIASTVENALTSSLVREVFQNKAAKGSLAPSAWPRYASQAPRDALKAMYREASGRAVVARETDLATAFTGMAVPEVTSELTIRNIVKTAQVQMNEGLYGADLQEALSIRFDPRDIKASLPVLRPVLAEQGLQGIYFIDPAVYSDYGTGCEEASRLHRSRSAVKYAKLGPSCEGCLFYTRNGMCSKLGKAMVKEPPYSDKHAQQQAILKSGKATEVDYASLINNGANLVSEYHLASQSMVQVDPEPEMTTLDIELGGRTI